MNIDQLLSKTESILDNYEKLSGLPEFSVFDVSEVSQYFQMTIEQLNNLTHIDCANASYLLAQYAFYIQRLVNRESARLRWATDQTTKLICDKIDNYSVYTKYDCKIALIAKENEAVNRLQAVVSYTSQTIERLNFLSNSIKNMSDIMSNIQKVKSFQLR